MATPNTIRQAVREEAARAINRRMEQTNLGESELETAIAEWDLSAYEKFFADCRSAGKSTSKCGAIWTSLKERGEAPAGGGGDGGSDTGNQQEGTMPSVPVPETVDELEQQFLAADQVYLITTTGCPACEAAQEALEEWISDGTIEVLNVQESDKAADIVIETGLSALPALVMEEDGEFTTI